MYLNRPRQDNYETHGQIITSYTAVVSSFDLAGLALGGTGMGRLLRLTIFSFPFSFRRS